MERRTISLRINPEIWKEVRLHCVENDIELCEFVEDNLMEGLKK